jgi:hypothetical protein
VESSSGTARLIGLRSKPKRTFKERIRVSDQTTFTPEEWSQIRTAPMLVTTGVTAADPSGIFGSIKEAAPDCTR